MLINPDPPISEFVQRSLIRPNNPVEYPCVKRVKAYVLFADLRGFSSWSVDASPEKVAEVYEVISERVLQMLIDYHYDYWKLLGDGIMLVWEVHEDESSIAKKAISAAFELHKKYWYYWKDKKSHVPEGFGIAICGGDVTKYVSATFYESVIITDYIGPIVNFAARLQTLANAGEVLVNNSVSQNSRHPWFSFEHITKHLNDQVSKLKGIPNSEQTITKVKHKYFNSNWEKFCDIKKP